MRKREKMTDPYAEEKRWVFSFDLKKRVKMNAGQREKESSRSSVSSKHAEKYQ